MNQTIQDLMTQILLVVIQVQSEGRFHGFYDLAGHVGRVDVDFDPADTDYQAKGRPGRHSRHVYITPWRNHYAAEERGITPEAETLRELSSLLEWAQSHLTENQQAGEAA